MIWTGLLGEADMPEALTFYKDNTHYGLRAPTKGEWRDGQLGEKLFLVGIRVRGELVAVAWIAWKSNFVHIIFTDDTLSLMDEGPFADSGGWCIRKGLQGRELLQLLAATVFVAWFKTINVTKAAPPLWGRMMGLKDQRGAPLFWSKVGESLTGLSYHNLLELPFGFMEREILARWPQEPVPLGNIPADALAAKGKTFEPLLSAGNRLNSWGCVNVPLYVPTSLNTFQRTTRCSLQESIGDIGAFFRVAHERAFSSLS